MCDNNLCGRCSVLGEGRLRGAVLRGVHKTSKKKRNFFLHCTHSPRDNGTLSPIPNTLMYNCMHHLVNSRSETSLHWGVLTGKSAINMFSMLIVKYLCSEKFKRTPLISNNLWDIYDWHLQLFFFSLIFGDIEVCLICRWSYSFTYVIKHR